MLRVYLLGISFLAAAAYCLFIDPLGGCMLIASMAAAVLGCYIVGTSLLAPLVREPARFLLYVFALMPAMVMVAAYLAIASIRYFKGDFTAIWHRVRRDRTV
jgi:hypothetical protein